jgi:hypothetical protein
MGALRIPAALVLAALGLAAAPAAPGLGVTPALAAPAAPGLGLAPASAVTATPLFVWQGAGPFNWSEAANWQGGRAPAPAGGPADLEFPLSACRPAPRTCDATTDDLPGLTLQTLTLAGVTVRYPQGAPPAEPRPAAYSVAGTQPLKLAGGIDAQIGEEGTGAGVEGATVSVQAPLQLTAPNEWTVGPGDGGVLQLGGSLTGRHQLDVRLLGEDSLELPAEVETGPVVIAGTPGASARVSIAAGSQVNAGDGAPLNLEDVTLYGSGTLGPLTLESAALRLDEATPGGDLRVNGDLTFAGRSAIDVAVPVADGQPPERLVVHGNAELGDATLQLSEGCPAPGQTYTLLEAEAGISGHLSNPDGQTIEDGQTIGGESDICPGGASAAPLRLEYGAATVTLTALAPAAGGAGAPAPPAAEQPAYDAAARALLASDLRWLGAGRRIGSILAGRGEDVAMTAPRPGVFTIQWRVRTSGRSLLVAAGRLVLPDGGTGQLRIILTRAGSHLLRRARRIRLTVLQSFASPATPTDLSQTTLLLRR